MYENKKVFILGMARSGYEAAKVLVLKGCNVLVADGKSQDEEKVKELESLGVKVVITPNQAETLDDTFDYVVKNPGIRFDNEVCKKAQSLGIPIINEVEIAYSFLPKDCTIIGITGSNGKTTTTTITYEILKKANFPVLLGGNIGYPVCSLVQITKPGDILVLEISGHQLHDAPNFKTNISIMTNLSEVHLDHFGTYDFYKLNKAHIFRHHTKNDLAILNKGNKDVLNVSANILSKKVYFSAKEKDNLYIEEGSIYYDGEKIVDLKDIKIEGNHNYENIMCAIAATKRLGVSNETIKEVLKTFGGVEHRNEFVREVNGRKFYNDSKSTNVEATQIALATFKKPTILLLGGLDRGHNFDDLKDYLTYIKAIIGYGQMKDKVREFADKNKKDGYVTETLSEAVQIAYDISTEGDVILLSPACASWDQYKDFEERGQDFKNIISELEKYQNFRKI